MRMHTDERNDDDFKQNGLTETYEISIYNEMQRELNEIAESLLRTQKISDASMRMSEDAVKQSNKALILSSISLGVTVIGAVVKVLIFLL